jgi:hypothetical protein
MADAIVRLLGLIVWQNLALAAVLAGACVAISYGAPLFEFILRKLLVDCVLRGVVFLGRVYIGLPSLKRDLSAGRIPDAVLATRSAAAIDKYTAWLEKMLWELNTGRMLVARAVFDRQRLAADLRGVEVREVALLDGERWLCEALGDDEFRRARGILNIAANPARSQLLDANLVRRALLVAMRAGAVSSRRLALYHLDGFVDALDQIAEVRQVIDTWSNEERAIGVKKVNELEERIASASP